MYVVSRRHNGFPVNEEDIERLLWYNVWQNRQWPYESIQEGEPIYLYNNIPNQYRLYKAELIKVFRTPLNNNLLEILNQQDYVPFEDDRYINLVNENNNGFLLAYRFTNVRLIQEIERYPNMPQLGWIDLRVNPIWSQLYSEHQNQ
jgi:hypothetical protein